MHSNSSQKTSQIAGLLTALFLLLLLATSCAEPAATTIQLTITFPENLFLDQLRISPSAPDINATPEPQLYPPESNADSASASESDTASDSNSDAASDAGSTSDSSIPLKSGVVLILHLPDTWDREQVTVTVEGLAQGAIQAHGTNQVIVEKQKNTMLNILLSAPCKSTCMAGSSQCVNDLVRFCRKDAQGCASWTPPEACLPATPFCSNGRCAATCEDECSETGQRRCAQDTASGQEAQSLGFQVCGQHDSDTCLDWGPEISCGAEELCRAEDNRCIPACDGKPCPCTAGETQVCEDVGQCKGGMSTCTDGQYGPCIWQQGPKAEICDGKDNDCNTHPDDGLVAEACANQQGVCQGAVKTCGGIQGWLTCGAADYAARATSQGHAYESNETLCDSQDNDCDSQTDEHEDCTCKPTCVAKVCGADDGCGLPCQTGSCPGANETCQSGTCICQPSCISKACGEDDGCGQPCPTGNCSGPNESCQSGICVCNFVKCNDNCCEQDEICSSGQCTVGCIASAPQSLVLQGTGSGSSLAVDSTGNVYISYYAGSQGLKYITNSSGSWEDIDIDPQNSVGHWISIAVDSANKVHVSYIDYNNADLKYATNASGSWTWQALDSNAYVEIGTSIGVDSADKVHISYHDENESLLKYATNISGSWQYVTLDSQENVGEYTSLALDSAGKVHISYYDGTNHDLKYATNKSGSWQYVTLDSQGDVGEYTSLALDSADKVHISYLDYTNHDLKYATNKSGSWQYVTLDSQGDVGEYTSLALDSAGKVHISYYDNSNDDLKYATNTSGSWQYVTLDSQGSVGNFTSLALDSGGMVHISYDDYTNFDLKYVTVCP